MRAMQGIGPFSRAFSTHVAPAAEEEERTEGFVCKQAHARAGVAHTPLLPRRKEAGECATRRGSKIKVGSLPASAPCQAFPAPLCNLCLLFAAAGREASGPLARHLARVSSLTTVVPHRAGLDRPPSQGGDQGLSDAQPCAHRPQSRGGTLAPVVAPAIVSPPHALRPSGWQSEGCDRRACSRARSLPLCHASAGPVSLRPDIS